MDGDMRKEVLGEVLLDELKAIREYVEEIPEMKKTLSKMDGRLENLETDMSAVNAVLHGHETDLKYLKHKVA